MSKGKTGPKPFKYTDEVIQKIGELSADGLFEFQIAHKIGRSPSQFSRDKHDNPAMEHALKKGEVNFVHKATKALGLLIDQGNTTAILFALKCKGGWIEAKEPVQAQSNITQQAQAAPSVDHLKELVKTAREGK